MLPDAVTLGLDLGQAQDYSALAVVEARRLPTGEWERQPNLATAFAWQSGDDLPTHLVRERVVVRHDVVHLERWPLKTSYGAVVTRTKAVLEQVRLSQPWREDLRGTPRHDPVIALVIDQTGVGAAVCDMFRDAGLSPLALTITGGDQVTRPEPHHVRVPKRDLVGVLQVGLQNRRFLIAEALPEAATLRKELEGFRARISVTTGHDTYGAGEEWRVGSNDDLVLAVAMAVWQAEQTVGDGAETVLGLGAGWVPEDAADAWARAAGAPARKG